MDVRQRGYAVEQGSVTPGLSSVARAALDHTGHPVAAVAVTYLEHTTDDAAHGELVRAVTNSAEQLSRRLTLRDR